MTTSQLLERLALHRQALDETYRAIIIRAEDDPNPTPLNELVGYGHVAAALTCLQSALDNIDRPTQTPAQPWITDTPPVADPLLNSPLPEQVAQP